MCNQREASFGFWRENSTDVASTYSRNHFCFLGKKNLQYFVSTLFGCQGSNGASIYLDFRGPPTVERMTNDCSCSSLCVTHYYKKCCFLALLQSVNLNTDKGVWHKYLTTSVQLDRVINDTRYKLPGVSCVMKHILYIEQAFFAMKFISWFSWLNCTIVGLHWFKPWFQSYTVKTFFMRSVEMFRHSSWLFYQKSKGTLWSPTSWDLSGSTVECHLNSTKKKVQRYQSCENPERHPKNGTFQLMISWVYNNRYS